MSTVHPNPGDTSELELPRAGQPAFTLGELGRARPLSELTDSAGLILGRPALDGTQMRQIADQALRLLSSFYVHLAGKRALYAVDPVQALRNLHSEIEEADKIKDDARLAALAPMDREREEMQDRRRERDFHDRMTAIFVSLRDKHTNYYLPKPYRGTIVFLPFLIEASKEGEDTQYQVTKIARSKAFQDDVFRARRKDEPQLLVTHWNGMPIERAVARSAEQNAGANRAARLARGLDAMTFRWLGCRTEPDEEWVSLTFTVDGRRHVRRFHWQAVQFTDADTGGPAPQGPHATLRGDDFEGERIRMVKEKLFFRPRRSGGPLELGGRSAAYSVRRVGGRGYGYLRIYSFACGDPGAFLAELRDALRSAPDDGLIIDIRGNPGGYMPVAEALLAMLSPVAIDGQGLQFLNTSEAIAVATSEYGSLIKPLIDNARETAAPFIESLPLRWPGRSGRAWEPDQVYQGPVVLIIDSLCFSASETFAAGMQDHDLGVIIGTDRQTGGGGGNVWPDDLIRRKCHPRRFLSTLAEGASFDIAIRRATRSGQRAGLAVEDMGVVVPPEHHNPLTTVDLMEGNRQLFAKAVQALEQDRPFLRADELDGSFTLHTKGIDWVDIYADHCRYESVPVPDGKTVALPVGQPAPSTLTFLGFGHEKVQPVTSLRLRRG